MMATQEEGERPAATATGARKKPRNSDSDLELGRSGVASSAFQMTTRVAPVERSGSSTGVRRRHSADSLKPAPYNRRRSSVLGELARAVQQAMPASDDTADTAHDGGAPDIPQKFNALFEHLCDENCTTAAALEALIVAWRRENLGTIDDPRILSFFDDALPSMMARHIQLEKNHRVAKKKTVFWTVLLTFCDTLSDYSAYIVLEMAGSGYATPMLVILVVSVMMQAIAVHFVTKEGPIATVGALLGLKPIIDGVNIVFNIPSRAGAETSLNAFGYTRSVETSTESIPFAIIQCLALMVERRSIAQWISLAISVGNIAHSVASVDYAFDTSPYFRAREPLCYGCYLPGARGDGLFASTAIFALGYVTAKLIALAVFGTVAGASLALVLVGESVTLLMVRIAIANWRWLNPAGDNAIISLITHFLLIHPIMLAAPFPFIRHPFILSPLLYAGFVSWTLFAANPLMLALAFRYYESHRVQPSRTHCRARSIGQYTFA